MGLRTKSCWARCPLNAWPLDAKQRRISIYSNPLRGGHDTADRRFLHHSHTESHFFLPNPLFTIVWRFPGRKEMGSSWEAWNSRKSSNSLSGLDLKNKAKKHQMLETKVLPKWWSPNRSNRSKKRSYEEKLEKWPSWRKMLPFWTPWTVQN